MDKELDPRSGDYTGNTIDTLKNAVANLADLLAFASGNPELVGYREPLLAYRARYGSATQD